MLLVLPDDIVQHAEAAREHRLPCSRVLTQQPSESTNLPPTDIGLDIGLNAYGAFDNDPAAAESFLRKVRSARRSAAFYEAAKGSSDEDLRRILNLSQPHWADGDIFKYALHEGDLANTYNTNTSTTMLVSALFVTISASLLLNPPSGIAMFNGQSRDQNDAYVRVFFYGMFLATISFAISILAGSATFMQQTGGIGVESDAPIVFAELAVLNTLTWATLISGVVMFSVGACTLVLAMYNTTDALIAVSFAAFVFLAISVHMFFKDLLLSKKIKELRSECLRRYLAHPPTPAQKPASD